MRKVLCLFTAAMIALCGCSNGAHTSDNRGNVNQTSDQKSDDSKPAMNSSDEPKTEKDPGTLYLKNVKQIVKIGEKIDAKVYDDIEFEYIVNKLYTTNKFEESIKKWNENALEEAEVKDGKLTGGRQILYVEYQVKNLSNKTQEYYISQTAFYEQKGELLQGSGEVGCSDFLGTGKSGYMTKIKPNETKKIRTGYIISGDAKGRPLYLNVSGSDSDCDFVLVQAKSK